jgi:hypothetical protein
LKRLVVTEADDGWYCLEKRFINSDVRFCIDGVIGQIEELDDTRFLKGLIVEAVACQLLFDQLTGSQFGK